MSKEDNKRKDSQTKYGIHPEFAGNYKGPLYAPHPDLKNERKTDSNNNRSR